MLIREDNSGPAVIRRMKAVVACLNVVLKQRTIPTEEIPETPAGWKGIDETPQCVARGGSTAARGKRSVFPKWCKLRRSL
ncbi:hypothetical protein GH741_08795 [Aquibacillus halophilus]|uniref:Uncharacterized protein n=1 Tax=Aquibacillus halophilus TaxID=930132 RepID=A0A6A8DAK8_9BACI|nr:hypothetical protein [Aquibacillus halophilus]MRH42783.1 hypothetical protein [Aquibacillus halophilus]